MWISKKKYEALLVQKEDFERIAMNALAQNGRLLDQWHEAIEEMKSIQELNHKLVEHNEELLARCRELEAELQGARQCSQQWADDFEELDLAYGRLDTDYDKLREERDHYEERCRYLEDEVEDLEARIVDKDAQNAELAGMVRSLEKKRDCLKVELSTAISQRDYYYDLLENNSEFAEGRAISREAE